MALNYADDRHMLLLAFEAFERALARWRGVRGSLFETEVFATVTECLWWMAALDERLHERSPETYRKERDKDADGRIVLGAYWARNRAGHLLGLVPRYRPGAELGRLLLGESALDTKSELVWRAASELPEGRNEFGRPTYERHLQGKPVGETFEALRRWFHGPHGPTIRWDEL